MTTEDRMKVLVVEDMKATAALIRSLLPEAMFEVAIAGDGEEALAAYAQWNPDAILLDVMIPFMSGFEVLKQIRSEDSETIIVMLTSLSSSDDVLSCSRLGIDGYLIKPVDVDNFLEKFIACLARRRPGIARDMIQALEHLV